MGQPKEQKGAVEAWGDSQIDNTCQLATSNNYVVITIVRTP